VYNSRNMTVTFGAGRIFTPAVIIFCILLGAGYAGVAWATKFVASWGMLSTNNVMSGKLWTLLTYSFFNSCGLPLAWDILVIIFIGSALENKWGAKSWIIFWVIMSATCGLIYLLASIFFKGILVAGSGACVYGLIGAFGLTFRHNLSYSFLGTIKAHHGALIMIAIGVLLSIPRPLSLIDVAGAAIACGYLKLLWKFNERKAVGPARGKSAKKPGAFVDVD